MQSHLNAIVILIRISIRINTLKVLKQMYFDPTLGLYNQTNTTFNNIFKPFRDVRASSNRSLFKCSCKSVHDIFFVFKYLVKRKLMDWNDKQSGVFSNKNIRMVLDLWH